MLTEALQIGDLEKFRELLNLSRGEKGLQPISEEQYRALCHAIKGREIEIFVLKEESDGMLKGFGAAALEFQLEQCAYVPVNRGRYFCKECQTKELQCQLEEYVADAMKVRGVSFPAKA